MHVSSDYKLRAVCTYLVIISCGGKKSSNGTACQQNKNVSIQRETFHSKHAKCVVTAHCKPTVENQNFDFLEDLF